MNYRYNNKKKQSYKKVEKNISLYEYVASKRANSVIDFLRLHNIEIVDTNDIGELATKLYQFSILNKDNDLVYDFMRQSHPDKELLTSTVEVIETPKTVLKAEGDTITPVQAPQPQQNQTVVAKDDTFYKVSIGIIGTLLLIGVIKTIK